MRSIQLKQDLNSQIVCDRAYITKIYKLMIFNPLKPRERRKKSGVGSDRHYI
jgi:hypothetical protein